MHYPRSRIVSLISFFAAALIAISIAPAGAQRQQSEGNPFKPPAATLHYARSRDFHVSHLKLVFDINAAEHSAHGVVTHTLAPLRDGLAQIVLDAGANLKIENCRVDGQQTRFTHDQNTLTILLPEPLPRGKQVAVEISYTMPGGKVGGGANGVGGFTWVDPRPSDPGRRPGFWTQGETNTNSNWVPCYDYPNDKCTSETITTVPEDWSVIGNGTEGPVISNRAKHTRTYHWIMTQPHSTYLLSLVGGELDIKKSEWEGVPLYYVVPKGKGDLIDASFGNTPDMLQLFSDKLGVKYPWPKYAQSAVYGFPGGMENVSATTLGIYGLTDARRGKYTMSGLTSHELAHQWFGDLVTCKDWGDIWLNESFATFFEMLYMEHLDGKERYDEEKEDNIRGYLRGAQRSRHALSTKLYSDPDAMFEPTHTYDKGGVILAMLRHQLGDADFFRGLGHYLKANAYQPVDAHDLEKAITEETGINVESFFDQWIFKPGHPILDMTWSYDPAAKTIVAHVKQLQDTSDGTPIYTTPLTIGLLRSDTSPAGGSVQRQQVTLDKADQEFRFAADAAPDAVLLDPDHDLLKEVKDDHWTQAELPVVLRLAPCHLDRLQAAQRLASAGSMDPATRQLFVDALRHEPSESVGVYLIGKLDSLKDESLRPLFREQVRSDQSQRRSAALTALGDLPPNAADTALLRTEAGSDTEPYNVVVSAMRALSHLDATGSLPVFRHQIGAKSLYDQLAKTAIEALTDTKADSAAPVLIEASAPPHPTAVRVEAIDSLSKVALNSPEVHTQLVALLKDPDPEIERTTVRTLQERKDREAVAALRTLATTATDKEVQQAASDAADNLSSK